MALSHFNRKKGDIDFSLSPEKLNTARSAGVASHILNKHFIYITGCDTPHAKHYELETTVNNVRSQAVAKRRHYRAYIMFTGVVLS